MALHTQEENQGRRYLTFAVGSLCEKVANGDADEAEVKAKYPTAVFREGVTPSGAPYAKWEVRYPGIDAHITGIELKKSNFGGKEVNVHLKDENDEEFTFTMGATTIMGANFLQTIPNIDFTKEITLKPYKAFKDKQGKDVPAGLNFKQGGEKIPTAFYDFETKKQLLGMPAPEVDKRTKEIDYDTYWPIRDKWLQDYLLDQGLMTYVEAVVTEEPDF
jgi:hypothetical protein